MKTANFISILPCLLGMTIVAEASEMPDGASAVVESYVQNYCHFVGDMKLEQSSVRSAKASTVAGYVESVKNVEVSLELVYGNDDETAAASQVLVLENTSGQYEIVKATGPCKTVIKHN